MIKHMIDNVLARQISIVTIIGWICAVIGLTFTVSSTYGEQRERLAHVTERQTKVEATLERMEAIQKHQFEMLVRIEATIQERGKK